MISGLLRSPFLKLTAYYLIVGLVGYLLISRFGVLGEAFSQARLDNLAAAGFGDPIPSSGSMRDPFGSALVTMFAIVGSLILLVPVAWVYMLTKQRQGYDESVLHTVLILPVPVTGLVIVVQDSIALAFSLAGIVAAVRFRNTLKDTKDAVYIFLAIGTALAAGVQALGIAAVTSMAFNYLVLVMWTFKFGNIYADQGRRTPKMRMGDVLAGAGSAGAGSGNLTIGDPELLAALAPKELGELAARKSRLVDRVRDSDSKKYNGLLIIYAEDSENCTDEIEEILSEKTKDFDLTELNSEADGSATLEYLVVLDKDISASKVVAAVRERVGQFITGAEFRIIDRKSLGK